jgi:hypothetical protein
MAYETNPGKPDGLAIVNPVMLDVSGLAGQGCRPGLFCAGLMSGPIRSIRSVSLPE